MKRIAIACLLSAAGVLGVQAAATTVSMPSLWRYAHPRARALIGVEWSRVAHSPLGRQLRKKISAAAAGKWKELDLFDDIDRIFISSPGKPKAGARQSAPVVFALQGRFDLKKIRKLVADQVHGEETYRSVKILEGGKPGAKPMALALVSPQALVIGDVGSVKAALDHQAAADPAQASDPLYLRASKLAATHDIWMVADAPPGAFTTGQGKASSIWNQVTGVDLGLSVRNGLGLHVDLNTRSPKSAAKLATGLQAITGMMLASLQRRAGGVGLANKLQVDADAASVHLALRMDRRELEQTLQGFGKLVAAGFHRAAPGDVKVRARVGGTGQWSWRPVSQPPVAKPPRKPVIRIYGLEGGVREIPFGR